MDDSAVYGTSCGEGVNLLYSFTPSMVDGMAYGVWVVLFDGSWCIAMVLSNIGFSCHSAIVYIPSRRGGKNQRRTKGGENGLKEKMA